jgi:two-component system, OmpR family, response regulator CpxR
LERRRPESNPTQERPATGWKRLDDPIGKSVLIAESDRVLGRLHQEALERDGWQVDLVHDGNSAMSRVMESTPDVLLLNTLPDLDLVAALERLRSYPPTKHLPVIVLLDTVDHVDLHRVRELGVLSFLIKSRMMRERLSQTITELLQKRKRPDGDETKD